ncbi:MAG TPA: polymer-forming cytoskeletal protein [Candidatus Acidoferrales bacterium]|nr:polymer-forming cytoskeletal protein [Candidatus Acidoferrales bacterium]
MWRKQPEAKPSSPVNPSTGGSSYAPPAQKPATSSASGAFPTPSQPVSTPAKPSADAVLTRGICIKGELTGKANLIIDGDLQGSIRLNESRLTVGQSGSIHADIEAREIFVYGRVDGDLRGRERVVLANSCHVEGDLEAPRVAIEDGARFNGRVEMGPAADARERQSKRGSQSFASQETSPESANAGSEVMVGTGSVRDSK